MSNATPPGSVLSQMLRPDRIQLMPQDPMISVGVEDFPGVQLTALAISLPNQVQVVYLSQEKNEWLQEMLKKHQPGVSGLVVATAADAATIPGLRIGS